MPREYFAYLFRYQGSDRYLLSYSDDRDGVHVDPARAVPSFATEENLRSYSQSHHLPEPQSEESTLLDLDSVEQFAETPRVEDLNCREILDTWNFFADIAVCFNSEGSSFRELDRSLDVIYDKVFHGNNLPAMTPEGQKFVPVWGQAEIRSIQKLMRAGFELFRSVVNPAD